MKSENTGFSLEITENQKKFNLKRLALPCFATVLFGCAMSMVGYDSLWWIWLISAGVWVQLGLNRLRTKITVLVVSLIALLFLLPGLKFYVADLFRRSMELQRYEYDMPEGASESLLAAALVVSALALGAVCSFGRGAAVVLTGVLAGVCAFFGVSPGPVWIGALVLCLAGLIPEGRGTAVIVASTAVLLVAGSLLLPSAYPDVKAKESSLRDLLAGTTIHYMDNDEVPLTQQTEIPTLPEQLDVTEEPEITEPAEDEGNMLLWLLIASTALVLFVPAALSDLLRKRIAKSRACFTEPDNRMAVCGIFRYSIRMLEFMGISAGNRPYGELCPAVADQLPQLEGYEEMAELWQEAAFSSHGIADEQRAAMTEFSDRLTGLVWQNCPWQVRFRIKYRHGLWGGRIWKT